MEDCYFVIEYKLKGIKIRKIFKREEVVFNAERRVYEFGLVENVDLIYVFKQGIHILIDTKFHVRNFVIKCYQGDKVVCRDCSFHDIKRLCHYYDCGGQI